MYDILNYLSFTFLINMFLCYHRIVKEKKKVNRVKKKSF